MLAREIFDTVRATEHGGVTPVDETESLATFPAGMPGIQKTRRVCGDDAKVAHTRIPVWVLEQARRLGMSESQILRDYPGLTREILREAFAYAHAHPQEIEEAIRSNEEA